LLVFGRRRGRGMEETFSYEEDAGPEGGVAGCEAHEYAVWTGVLETRAAEWS